MELTSYQQSLADHDQYHALCIAVAGSGKTSTLAQLILSLLNKGEDPRRVMVMMFNKAAQVDFTRKLRKIAHQHVNMLVMPEIRTYHSTGLKLLRTLEDWGLREPYNKKPLSEKVIELQVRSLILKLAPDTIKDRIRSDAARIIEAAISFIESVKAHLLTPEQWFEKSDYTSDYRFFIKLFHQFEQWRNQEKSITFTDMLYDPVTLILANPEVIPSVENKMNYIIVDEYQDTSSLQHRFTRLLAGSRAKMVAVGDPDQTIYEFAGANIDNILHHFQKDYGDTGEVQELTLPHTFRYGHSIALAASHLISQNRARKNIICIAHPENKPSLIRISQSDSDDSRLVADTLQDYLASGIHPEEIAILVRVWAQAVPIELNLLEKNIPYTSNGPSLFQRAEIESLVDAMILASGGFADLDSDIRYRKFFRLLTLPHLGLKNHHIDWICQHLKHHTHQFGKPMANMLPLLKDISDFQAEKLLNRAELFNWLEDNGLKKKAHSLIATYIQKSGIYDSLKSMSLNEQRTEEQILAIKGFHRFLRQLDENTVSCCQHIAELIEKRKQQKNQRQHHRGVLLSSCHRSKGLEWRVVLLPGLIRQYWPFLREDDLAIGIGNAIESERRLLYVAMTRAKEQLHLFTVNGDLNIKSTKARDGISDQNSKQKEGISPFIQEMNLPHILSLSNLLHDESDDELLDAIHTIGLTTISRCYIESARPALTKQLKNVETIKAEKHQTSSAITRTPSHSPDGPWQLKATIHHAIFGIGEVVEVNDSNFSVRFDSRQHGVRKFAKIEEIRHLFTLLHE